MFKIFKKCKHEWHEIDRHCLGMNPPRDLVIVKCNKCGKVKDHIY